MKRYEIKAKGKSAEVWIYQEIGGYWDGLTAKQFADDMKKLGNVETINVRMNSPGGDVFDGIAIHNILRQNAARVVVNIDGMALSIASVIAMAGDEIVMANNAMMMIHSAWGFSIGNADEMRKTADMLDKVDSTIVDTYQRRTKKDASDISTMMSAETWMTAQEALDAGFVDSLAESLDLAAHFDLSRFRYRNAPQPADLSGAQAEAQIRNRLARMNLACSKRRNRK